MFPTYAWKCNYNLLGNSVTHTSLLDAITVSLLPRQIVGLFFLRRGPSEGEGEGEKHHNDREAFICSLLYAPRVGTEPATQECAVTGN